MAHDTILGILCLIPATVVIIGIHWLGFTTKNVDIRELFMSYIFYGSLLIFGISLVLLVMEGLHLIFGINLFDPIH
jgi:hypothetical protein